MHSIDMIVLDENSRDYSKKCLAMINAELVAKITEKDRALDYNKLHKFMPIIMTMIDNGGGETCVRQLEAVA